MLFLAGSQDMTSLYEKGVRAIWENASSVNRSLLTFDNAGHNAAAPMPAPEESFRYDEKLGFNVSAHYIDKVWDTVRMNNIAQHFSTAFMDLHLKGEPDKAVYFNLIPNAADGLVDLDDAGLPTGDHTYWRGFGPRTAAGMQFESKPRGQ